LEITEPPPVPLAERYITAVRPGSLPFSFKEPESENPSHIHFGRAHFGLYK